MKDKKLITFIVPAYNVEKYLDECIQSLLNQTVMDHKIIIVDDGSKDNTGYIADKYEKSNPDIVKVIHQENKGLGAARNAAMAAVDTPYVTFLDSDDWMNRRFVAAFKNKLDEIKVEPEMVFTMPIVFDMQTKVASNWKDYKLFNSIFDVIDGKSSVITNIEEKKELYGLEVSSCRKVYSRAFLEKMNFKFPEGIKWEDTVGHFQLLHHSKIVAGLPESGFFYRVNHPGQITSKSGKSRMDMIKVTNDLLDMCEKEAFTEDEKVHVISLIMRNVIWSLNVINSEYIHLFIEGVKSVFDRITDEEKEYYLYWISPEPIRDRALFNMFETDECFKLSDYMFRKDALELDKKRKVEEPVVEPVVAEPVIEVEEVYVKKSAQQRLFACLADHGIKYTAKLFIKKFVLHRA